MSRKVGSLEQWEHIISRINGKNCTAVIFGGFGFKERHIQKHASLYKEFDFNVVPILSSIRQMTRPRLVRERSREFAKMLEAINQPLVLHTISASSFTLFHTLKFMDKEWRDLNVKAIVFDSSPPKSDCHALGAGLAFLLKRNYLKPYLAPLWYPYTYWLPGFQDWQRELDTYMFGASAVIPRNASMLFIRGKNDNTLDIDYLVDFIADVREHKAPNASVSEKIFENSRHTMSVIDERDEYRRVHATQLLLKVPDFVKGHPAGE